MMTLEELKAKIEQINKEISNITYISDEPERYNDLWNKRNRLLEMERIFNFPKVVNNDELDIYAEQRAFNHVIYHLTLHNDVREIGYVRITYNNNNTIYGNIGYEIRYPYRGHNFAFKALELLEDIMIEKGLVNPIITAYPNNLPSIRIIEKFGGVLIEDSTNGINYNKYQVELLNKKETNIKQKLKRS